MKPKNLNCPYCGDELHLLVELNANPGAVDIPYWLKDLSYSDEREGICFACRKRSIPVDMPDDDMHDQARKFREALDFTEAVSAYTDIVNESAKDAEAFWFRALSRQSIAGGHESGDMPVFFEAPSELRLQDDEDFKKACNCILDAKRRDEFRSVAEQLDKIRENYFAIRNSRKEYQVYLCASDAYYSAAERFASILRDEELEVFIGGSDPAEICFARNSAKVMAVLGSPDAETLRQKTFFDKRFEGQSGFRLISVSSETEKATAGISSHDRWYDASSGWEEAVLDCIRDIYPKREVTTTIVQQGDTYVVEDAHTQEAIDHAYECFIKKEFKDARESAERALQNGSGNIPCKFINAFYLSYVENTSNRGAMGQFFSSTVGVTLSADDVAKMKNLFLVAAFQIKNYEEAALRMLLNSEVGSNNMCAFVDSFSARIIPKRSGIGFLTQGLCEIYTELARTNTIPKTCLALMQAVNTNTDSPIPQNDFYLKTKAINFYSYYFLPIGDIIRAMKDDGMRKKFEAVYNNELKKYSAKMG